MNMHDFLLICHTFRRQGLVGYLRLCRTCYVLDRVFGWSRWQAFRRCWNPAKNALAYPQKG